MTQRIFHAPPGCRRLTINLKEEIWRNLKLKAIEMDTTVTDIISDLVEEYLETNDPIREYVVELNKLTDKYLQESK
jgi:macrodomain Ter protein organizer (MatP/YcbG family)